MMPTLSRMAAKLFALWGWLVVALASLQAQAAAPEGAPTVRRFALIVGANDGGPDRTRLRFATSDADAMADVLRDLGGVKPSDLVELRDPTPAQLEFVLLEIARRLKSAEAAGTRTQFLFYYSGHSDELGLLLADETVSYRDLRKRVQSVPADVRIAILDSCASGAFTRLKGGTRRPPFLAGSTTKVEGHAFLTSSSANEAAQESDRVGGSYFTHFLATGLRGAADVDGDRFVTLIEAYEFAFDETLERTEASRGGAQHAAYDIQLAGSGDLVMTDLRKTSATLRLADDVGGRVYVRGAGGRLVAELYKPPGAAAVDLGLEAGRYQITVDDGKVRRRTDVVLARKGRAEVSAGDLRVVKSEPSVARGGDTIAVPFDIGLVPAVSLGHTRAKKAGNPKAGIVSKASFGIAWNRNARIEGISIGMGASIVDDEIWGAQLSMGAAIARGKLLGWQAGQFFNHAGVLTGVQTSMVNSATEVEKGVQIGLIDVAKRVHGVQVGLITWADEADAAIGLVALTRKGNVHPEFSTSDVAGINLALRFPARYTYTLLSMGVHPGGRGRGWLVGGGLGGHIPLQGPFFLDIDMTYSLVLQKLKVNRKLAWLGQLRMMFVWQARDRLALFAGPTLSGLTHHDDPDDATLDAEDKRIQRPGYGWVVGQVRRKGILMRIWPGFVVGLRF